MPWVRLEDDFYDHDKFDYVGPLGVALFVAGLAYCNRNLTDGTIPKSKAARLLDFEGISVAGDVAAQHDPTLHTGCYARVAQMMLEADLWHEDGHDCGECEQPGPRHYVVHDYLRYQPSKAKVERERTGSRERMAKSRRNRSGSSDDVAPQHGEKFGGSSTAPNPNPEGSKEPSRPRKRGTRLPDIFPITDDMATWGREHAPDIEAHREHEKFCDYWRGVAGQRGVKQDWIATWRNWMRRAQEDIEARRPKTVTDDRPEWMQA